MSVEKVTPSVGGRVGAERREVAEARHIGRARAETKAVLMKIAGRQGKGTARGRKEK